MGRRKKNDVAHLAASQARATDADVVPTRRSLRQQARQAAQTKYTNSSSEESGDEGHVSDDGSEIARFTPLSSTTPVVQRNKRFLKESQIPQRKKVENESTATVLSRLIGNRTTRGGRGRVGFSGRGRGRPPTAGTTRLLTTSKNALMRATATGRGRGRGRGSHQGKVWHYNNRPLLPKLMELPLEVQIAEPGQQPGVSQSKRGRKRKVDFASQLPHSIKVEPGQSQPLNLTTTSQLLQNSQQRKRGRQSAATETVKPRFPFCTFCLSKTPPNDYIINYMSCPNEYQRMKRLFVYIYKDMKYPFVPFDLERDNVFDYCDLPLCDCCIQLYREIYDCYSQIETARDQLKTKIDRMVYQIQLAEKNPAVAAQVNAIKSSPDSLMNKYSNFRRKFCSYRPGENRKVLETSSILPASIARIQIVNQVHKRTTGSQTFLTAGDFPAKTPKLPDPNQPNAEKVGTSTSGASVAESTAKPQIKTEPDTVAPKPGQTAKPDKTEHSSNNLKDKATAKSGCQEKAGTSSGEAQKPSPVPPSKPPTQAVINRNSQGSVLTIVKTPGGNGPAIIRKIPTAPVSKPLPKPVVVTKSPQAKANGSEKTPISASASSSNKNPPKQQFTKTFIYVPKDEPDDNITEVEEPDPFLSSSTGSVDANSDSTKPVSASGSDADDNSSTNVFRKHKKLRVVPVQSYDETSKKSSNEEVKSSGDEGKSEKSSSTVSEIDNGNNDKKEHEPKPSSPKASGSGTDKTSDADKTSGSAEKSNIPSKKESTP